MDNEGLRAATLLLGTLLVVYAPVVFLGRSLQAPLYHSKGVVDTGAYGYQGRTPINTFSIDLATPAYYEWSLNKVVGEAYRRGEFPLWNPYQGAGTPLAAQYSSRSFFPYQVLMDLLPVATWDFFFLGRLWFAGFFTFLFLRLVGVSWLSAVLGGVVYMYSGTFVWFINLEQMVNTAMVAPVLLWALEGLWHWGWQRGAVAAGASGALVLLAGQPEVALFVLVLGVAYGLFRVGWTAATARRQALLACILAGVLSVLLAMPLLLPFFEFERLSFNLHPPGGTMGVQEPARLFDLPSVFIPSFFVQGSGERYFPDNGRWDWLGGYLGVTPAFLTVLGLTLVAVQPRSPWRGHLLFFAAFGAVVMGKSFGFPLVAWLGWLPLLDQAWGPRWSGPAWTFSFAVAAALGLEALRDQARGVAPRWWRERGLRVWQRFLKTARQPDFLLYLGLILLILAVPPVTWFFQKAGVSGSRTNQLVSSPYFSVSVVLGVLVALLVAAVAAGLAVRCLRRRAAPEAFIGLALVELWFAVPWGYEPLDSNLRLLPLLAGLAGVFALARRSRRWASAAGVAVLLIAIGIDVGAVRGLPERYDPAIPAPYVRFLQSQPGYYRVMGGNGVLMPNFASAVGLYDIRYINALSDAAFQAFRDSNLHTTRLWASQGSSLWFTGNPELDLNIDGAPRRLPVDFGEEIRAQLPFYSLLGVKYILTPSNYRMGLELGSEDILTNGDFTHWSRGNGPFSMTGEQWADGWDVDLKGRSQLTVSRGSDSIDGYPFGTGIVDYVHDAPSYVRYLLPRFDKLLGKTITFSMRVRADRGKAVRIGISGAGTGTTWSDYHPGDNRWHQFTVTHRLPSGGVQALVVLAELNASGRFEIADATLVPGTVAANRSLVGYYTPLQPADPTYAEAPRLAVRNMLKNGGFESWPDDSPFTYEASDVDGRGTESWATPWTVLRLDEGVVRVVKTQDGEGNSRYAVRMEQRGLGQAHLGQVVESVRPSTPLALSVRVRTWVRQAVRVGLAFPGQEQVWSPYHPGDGAWRSLSIVAKSPPSGGTSEVRALIALTDGATAYADNAMLVPGDRPISYVSTTYFPVVYDKEIRIYENRGVLPRAFVAHEVEASSSYLDAHKALQRPGFDLLRRVVLEAPLPEWAQRLQSASTSPDPPSSSAAIIRYSLTQVAVEAETAAPGVLVLTDVYQPAWNASIDGREAQVVRVDGVVRGVFLEPGRHIVVFHYFPRSFALGLVLASVGALVSAALLLAGQPSSRRQTA